MPRPPSAASVRLSAQQKFPTTRMSNSTQDDEEPEMSFSNLARTIRAYRRSRTSCRTQQRHLPSAQPTFTAREVAHFQPVPLFVKDNDFGPIAQLECTL